MTRRVRQGVAAALFAAPWLAGCGSGVGSDPTFGLVGDLVGGATASPAGTGAAARAGATWAIEPARAVVAEALPPARDPVAAPGAPAAPVAERWTDAEDQAFERLRRNITGGSLLGVDEVRGAHDPANAPARRLARLRPQASTI